METRTGCTMLDRDVGYVRFENGLHCQIDLLFLPFISYSLEVFQIGSLGLPSDVTKMRLLPSRIPSYPDGNYALEARDR